MGSRWVGLGPGSRLLRWTSGAFDEPLPLRTVHYPLAFPHTFPILLALAKREPTHSFEFVRGKGFGEVRESGLHCSSLAGKFHLHHLKGEEGILCVLLGFLELLEDVRALPDCRLVDPIGIDT